MEITYPTVKLTRPGKFKYFNIIILQTAYHTPEDLMKQNLEATVPYNTKTKRLSWFMNFSCCLFTAASAEGIEDCSSLSVNIQCLP